ncbi:hypothetical protein ACFY2M_42880 [Streptomyces sp. NPDC001276]|uniref:hypothetical protein n=1 Tax=Streptomyces sp. NPDC001276 TaxID=3364555 RepID=UPI00367B2CD4
MTTPGGHPEVLGPDTPLARVLAFCETSGHAGPAGAWQELTRAWNWAAPLTTAVPRVDFPGPVARPVPGGFALSGQWRLSSPDGTGPWLVLPLAPARSGDPDLFVAPSRVLPGAVRVLTGEAGPDFRLEDVYVPAGFVTHTAGTPLRAGDAVFLWTAVTGLALGAARRMTDALAAPTGPELAAVLHDERLILAAVLHGGPSARQGLPEDVERRLAARVGQAGSAVHQVVAVAYEHVLAADDSGVGHPLTSLIEAASPILQQVRYVMELLPRDDRTSPRKAEPGDDRRISG